MEEKKTIVIPLDLNPNVHWDIINTVCAAFPDYSVMMIGVITDSDFKMPSEPNFRWIFGCPYDSGNIGYLRGASCVLLAFRGDCVLDMRFCGPARGTHVPTVVHIPGRFGVGGYLHFRIEEEGDAVYQVNLALGLIEPRPEPTTEERALRAIGDYQRREGIGSAAYNDRDSS